MKTKINILHAVPRHSASVSAAWSGDGWVLSKSRFPASYPKLAGWLPRCLSKPVEIRLERFGSAVWPLIDGRRTCRQIAALAAEQFPGEDDFANRVLKYLSCLHRDGLITLHIPEEPRD